MKLLQTLLLSLLLPIAFTAMADNHDPLVSLFKFQSKMAATGNGLAMYKLGEMYEKGEGTKQDYFKALEMYRKAQEKGVGAADQAIVRVNDKIANRNRVQKPAGKSTQDEARKEAARREAARKEKARKEAARREAARREKARKEAARREAARREKARKEAARREAARREKAREEAARQEAARREKAREEAARQEEARREAARREAARKEQARQAAASQAAVASNDEDTGNEETPQTPASTDERKKDKGFKSDVCNSPAARFISSCKNR